MCANNLKWCFLAGNPSLGMEGATSPPITNAECTWRGMQPLFSDFSCWTTLIGVVRFVSGGFLLLVLVTLVRCFFAEIFEGDASTERQQGADSVSLGGDRKHVWRDFVGGLLCVLAWGILHALVRRFSAAIVDLAAGVIAGFSIAALFSGGRAVASTIKKWVDRITTLAPLTEDKISSVVKDALLVDSLSKQQDRKQP